MPDLNGIFKTLIQFKMYKTTLSFWLSKVFISVNLSIVCNTQERVYIYKKNMNIIFHTSDKGTVVKVPGIAIFSWRVT